MPLTSLGEKDFCHVCVCWKVFQRGGVGVIRIRKCRKCSFLGGGSSWQFQSCPDDLLGITMSPLVLQLPAHSLNHQTLSFSCFSCPSRFRVKLVTIQILLGIFWAFGPWTPNTRRACKNTRRILAPEGPKHLFTF